LHSLHHRNINTVSRNKAPSTSSFNPPACAHPTNQPTNIMACFNCKQHGHKAVNCPYVRTHH